MPRAASKIMASRIIPRALELMDQAALRAVENYLKEDLSQGAAAMLIIEVDGPAETTERESARVADILTKAGAARVQSADAGPEREQLWKARRSISRRFKRSIRKK